MKIVILLVMGGLVGASTVWADCRTLDLSTWTAEERSFLGHAAAKALNQGVSASIHIENSNEVVVCAEGDPSSLNAATLQADIQTFLAARDAADTARQTAQSAARTEVQSNVLCKASYAQLAQRIDDEKAAIQADIDAMTNITTAKTAMTTLLNRTMAAFKLMLRCERSRALLQGEE